MITFISDWTCSLWVKKHRFLSLVLTDVHFGGTGHLLMPAAMRGRRAAVKAGERRVAEPHSIAFSCRMHLQKHVY